MRIESRLFEFVAAFFIVVGVMYAILTALFGTSAAETGGVEWAGTTALLLTGVMALIVATFFRFVARRLDTRPEDYEAAEISDGASDAVGSPFSRMRSVRSSTRSVIRLPLTAATFTP